MKKFLSLLIAALFIASAATAANIPSYFNPKDGPEVWTTSVYNGQTIQEGTLLVGDVVVWDIANSSGDDGNWVAVTTTADTHLVAGVVYGATIQSGSAGTIAIRGVADVDVNGTVAAGQLLCSSTTAGEADQCVNEDANFAIVTEAGTGTTVKAFINP